uniref:Dimer_Tnp_hAT domain-containing protein n=1 Tax=Heterorhabditis bacteriophora TaxID=37862 RepID=A0A1I7WGK9_HETBA
MIKYYFIFCHLIFDMKQRFTPIWESKQNIVATSLDPSLMSKTDWDLIEEHIVNTTHAYIIRTRIGEKTFVNSYKGSVYIISFIMNFSMSNYQIELTTYSKNPVHIDCNFLDFWSRSQLLVRLARRPFSLVPTSIANERLFSKAGILYGNTLRNRLTRVKAEKLLFLQAMLHSSMDPYEFVIPLLCETLLTEAYELTTQNVSTDDIFR